MMNDRYEKKHDKGKTRLSLVPTSLVERVGEVLTFGAEKYSANSWREVPDAVERYTDALLRHVYAHLGGEVFDNESGLSHLAHAGANIAFLLELLDDKIRMLEPIDTPDEVKKAIVRACTTGETGNRVFSKAEIYGVSDDMYLSYIVEDGFSSVELQLRLDIDLLTKRLDELTAYYKYDKGIPAFLQSVDTSYIEDLISAVRDTKWAKHKKLLRLTKGSKNNS